MNDTNKALRHSLYGVFFALKSALPPESARLASEVVKNYLNNPDLEPEERLIYEVIVDGCEPPAETKPPHLQLVVNNA
jgi:hypothetical protein